MSAGIGAHVAFVAAGPLFAHQAQAPAQVPTVKRTTAAQAAHPRSSCRAAARAAGPPGSSARPTPRFGRRLERRTRHPGCAAIIYNPQTGDVLWENNSHDQRSIASLTKLMTAVTFVADDPTWRRVVTPRRCHAGFDRTARR
jgi:D-alanyl-D-alanine carboxypeptidase